MAKVKPKDGVLWPTWLLNDIGDNSKCKWSMCKVKPVLPAFMPPALQKLHSALEIADGPYKLPAAAIKFGTWMTAAQLKKLALANQVMVPAGTGKLNETTNVRSVLKRDWARALVAKLWPDASKDEQAEMVQGLVFGAKFSVATPEQVLKSVQLLDHDNAETFKGLRDLAEKAAQDSERARGRGGLIAISRYVLQFQQERDV